MWQVNFYPPLRMADLVLGQKAAGQMPLQPDGGLARV
jgi:hypothetical protein